MAIYNGIIDMEHKSLTMTAQSPQTVRKVFIGRLYQHVLLFLFLFFSLQVEGQDVCVYAFWICKMKWRMLQSLTLLNSVYANKFRTMNQALGYYSCESGLVSHIYYNRKQQETTGNNRKQQETTGNNRKQQETSTNE